MKNYNEKVFCHSLISTQITEILTKKELSVLHSYQITTKFFDGDNYLSLYYSVFSQFNRHRISYRFRVPIGGHPVCVREAMKDVITSIIYYK